MSGLASAFLFAGARFLLVSHWQVQSQAAVLLTTATFNQLAAHPEMARAEALRRAIDALIAVDPEPSVWGPFSLVGGGRPDPALSADQTLRTSNRTGRIRGSVA